MTRKIDYTRDGRDFRTTRIDPNQDTIRIRPIKVRRPWGRTRKAIVWSVASLLAVPMIAGMAVGTAKAVTKSSTPTTSLTVTHDDYRDCIALAARDGFAVDVCEALDPNSDIAKKDCANDPVLRANNPDYCTTTRR